MRIWVYRCGQLRFKMNPSFLLHGRHTARVQRDFLANHLGPQLRKSHPNVKIFIFDHNKDHAPVWLRTILNSTAAQYVNGTAIHWYAGGMDRLLDGSVGQPNMHRVLSELEDFGHKNEHVILGSEACHCPYTGYGGGDINIAWARAEQYAHTILADLAAGSNGWAEWNLMYVQTAMRVDVAFSLSHDCQFLIIDWMPREGLTISGTCAIRRFSRYRSVHLTQIQTHRNSNPLSCTPQSLVELSVTGVRVRN